MISVHILATDGREAEASFDVPRVLVAGYTGRDRAKVLEHVRELEEVGVAPPPRVPMVYVLSSSLLTTGSSINVAGAETSGEVEFYLIGSPSGLLVGVASDHTDRRQETIDVQGSKEICPHPISANTWRYEEVRDHWDQIEIRSWANGRLYQEGRLDAFMPVEAMLAELRQAGYAQLDNHVIYGGTVPTLEGFVYAPRFEAEMRDPVLGRSLTCAYDVVTA